MNLEPVELKEVVLEKAVTKEGLAMSMKSGSLPVLATPQMIAWMEEAACACLDLPENLTSVGIRMDVSHDAPSPEGAMITVYAKIVGQKKSIISYEVAAYMNETCIGKGEHVRAVVDIEKFMSKLA